MFKTIEQVKNKEKGFSLLELSVAVGIAAIVAVVAITATTGFVNGASTAGENYQANASDSVTDSKASFDALWREGEAPNSVGEYSGGAVALQTSFAGLSDTLFTQRDGGDYLLFESADAAKIRDLVSGATVTSVNVSNEWTPVANISVSQVIICEEQTDLCSNGEEILMAVPFSDLSEYNLFNQSVDSVEIILSN